MHSMFKFWCVWPQCQFLTNNKSHLKRHAFIHSEKKFFKCDFENCNKMFKLKDSLNLKGKI
jgi:uncharacterized Zn-finger protein